MPRRPSNRIVIAAAVFELETEFGQNGCHAARDVAPKTTGQLEALQTVFDGPVPGIAPKNNVIGQDAAIRQHLDMTRMAARGLAHRRRLSRPGHPDKDPDRQGRQGTQVPKALVLFRCSGTARRT